MSGIEHRAVPHVVDQRETYRNTLQYALAIAGSELALAVRLEVPVAKLKHWLEGVETIPDAAFLAAVDVIIGATPADIARTRGTFHKTGSDEQRQQ